MIGAYFPRSWKQWSLERPESWQRAGRQRRERAERSVSEGFLARQDAGPDSTGVLSEHSDAHTVVGGRAENEVAQQCA